MVKLKNISQTKLRTLVYGTNFIIPSAVNLLRRFVEVPGFLNRALNKMSDAANSYGAVIFGTLDIIGSFSEDFRESKYTRLSKVGGLCFYGISTVADAFSIANGDYNSYVSLPFNASMAYTLGRDVANIYKGKRLIKDLEGVVNDVGDFFGKIKNKKDRKKD
ncbi:MAG: hypothetical protein KatS3mg001_141 [Candidatus Pacearchaeota archaeon]|nr:MAG: hypothetical protein KatS3mg001_141 [Candidatus Pacearchaeota archaeon]